MKRSGFFTRTVILTVLVFFHLPLMVLVINSFNASRFGGTWEGFTTHWYSDLFRNREVMEAFKRSLVIALWSTPAATLLGTLAAVALHRFHSRLQKVHFLLVQLPLVLPDVLMGFSMLLFFVAMGINLGLTSIWVAHVTFCLSFVTMVMLGRLQDFDFTLLDAARDLGATRWQATTRILLPLLWPGILASALLAFTVSLDDFVITFFVSGPGTTTLPVQIYSMMKTSRSLPIINALSSLLLFGTVITVASIHWLTRPTRKL
jgi:spermidine/putrescine transport system permease protein